MKWMEVRSNLQAWLYVNDISTKIPPKGKGMAYIADDVASSSAELKALVKNGSISITVNISGIRPVMYEDRKFYAVPSTNVWGTPSKVPEYGEYDEADESEAASKKVFKEVRPRKFRIRRGNVANVNITCINANLSKFNDSIVVDSTQYYFEEVQKAISSGIIILDEVIEETSTDDGVEQVATKVRDHSEIDKLLAPGKPCVFWEGPIFDGGGYANMNRQYVFNLDDLGIHIKPTLISTLMDVEDDIRERIVSLSHNIMPLQSPKVFATNVPNTHTGRSIAYTMMETENVIHPSLVQKLLVADEIWVPCEWNRRIFENSGVKRDMKVMPLGVDHLEYKPSEPTVSFEGGTNEFVFLSVFNWNWRKGFDVMLKAYARAFSSSDNVSLVLVSRFIGQKSMSARIFDDIKKIISSERCDNLPHLSLVDDVIPTFLMPRIYNSADSFVLFSRGEGYGLPYAEAGASGIPILGANHGGQKMFLDDDVSMLVTPDKISHVDASIEWISPFYHGMEFADYSNKAIDEAAEKMRWMYDNRDKLHPYAAACRQKIVNSFTWQLAAKRVADRITDIQP